MSTISKQDNAASIRSQRSIVARRVTCPLSFYLACLASVARPSSGRTLPAILWFGSRAFGRADLARRNHNARGRRMGGDRKPEFFAGKDTKSESSAAATWDFRWRCVSPMWARVTGFDTRPGKSRQAQCGPVLHPAHSAEKIREHVKDRRFDATADFSRLREDGRRPDLRAHSARRTSRTRSELRRRHGEGDRPEPCSAAN